MMELFVFGLFIAFGVATLVIWPILLHPTLPGRKKFLISMAAFIVLVPLGVALYVWLGVPQMAEYR